MDESIREIMKTYKNLYDYCLSYENRRISIKGIKKSKRIKNIIKRRHLSDEYLIDYARDLLLNFEPHYHTPKQIYDGITRKVRTIIVPSLEELIVQYCVVNALKPILSKGMYEHSYGSIPERGAHKAKKYVERWIQNVNIPMKYTKYVLKTDIKHFFDNISHDVLKSKFVRVIKDEEMLELIFKIIDTTEKGLPLGFYTSQWFSHWYLQEFDHYVKEVLNVRYYVRYADDMVIFGSNKRQLHRIRVAMQRYLHDFLGLDLKKNWQVFLLRKGEQGRDLDFMGFRFFRDRTILRKSIMFKACRKANRISKKTFPTIHDNRQIMSYLGWIKYTDVYIMYKERIKSKISLEYVKRRISEYDKKTNMYLYTKIIRSYAYG